MWSEKDFRSYWQNQKTLLQYLYQLRVAEQERRFIIKYYFDGKKIRTTSCKVTAKYVYFANGCYRKPLGFKVFSTPEAAINFWIKTQKSKIHSFEDQVLEIQKEIKTLQRTVNKVIKKNNI